jgi:hypothetical protein
LSLAPCIHTFFDGLRLLLDCPEAKGRAPNDQNAFSWKHRSVTEHRLEAYATLAFRTIFQTSQLPINIFGDPENRCHRSTAEVKDRRGVGFKGLFFLRNRTNMNWSCKAIWYTDEGYEIYLASERNWISYGPDGWVHLAISLDEAKQVCDSQEKLRTDILRRP